MFKSVNQPYIVWSAVLLAAAVTFATQILLASSLFAITVVCFEVETPLCLAISSAVAFFVGGQLGASASDGRMVHALCHAMLTWTVATITMLLLATSGTPGPVRTVASGPWAIGNDTAEVLLSLTGCALSAGYGAWRRSSRKKALDAIFETC